MKFNTRLLTLGVVLTFSSSAIANETAESLFGTKCSMCHSKSRPSDMSKVLAPALMGIMRHIKMSYPKKDDAVKFMVDYVLEPSKEKAICMPQKIEKFGLMPSQKENISKDELTQISSWMFDNFPSTNFKGMGHENNKVIK